jgi:hypothetical protein
LQDNLLREHNPLYKSYNSYTDYLLNRGWAGDCAKLDVILTEHNTSPMA